MKLRVMDRLMLLNILPPEGDLLTMRIIHGLRQRLSFTETEYSVLNFETSDDGKNVKWNPEADEEVEIEIGSKAEQIIRDRLDELGKQKKLTEAHLPICDKFFAALEE